MYYRKRLNNGAALISGIEKKAWTTYHTYNSSHAILLGACALLIA